MAVKAKQLRYEVAIDESGRASAEESEPGVFGAEWSAEHLVLAGLVRCSLTSLSYFARMRGASADGSGGARGMVTKDDDGAYRFVEITCSFDVTIEPEPDDLAGLLRQAEWGCFVGQSLRSKPAYTWRVNGRES